MDLGFEFNSISCQLLPWLNDPGVIRFSRKGILEAEHCSFSLLINGRALISLRWKTESTIISFDFAAFEPFLPICMYIFST